MPRIILPSLLTLGVLMAASAYSEMPAVGTVAAFTDLRALGARIEPLEEVSGLHAWAVIRDDQAGVVYTSLDGRYLIQGMIYDTADPAKASVTVRHQQQAVALAQKTAALGIAGPAVPPAKAIPTASQPTNRAEAFWAELVAAPGIDYPAPNQPQLLMVVDPTCPYCLATWRELAPLVGKRLAVKLVLLSGAEQSSAQLAAWLLDEYATSPDVARRAWHRISEGVLPESGFGGSSSAFSKLQGNAQLAQRRNISGTPFLVYRAGGKIRVLTGRPDNLSAVLAEMQP